MRGGGRADRVWSVCGADVIHGLFSDQAGLACSMEADLLGGLAGVYEVLTLEDEPG
ncbi:hypothetical protein ACWGQ5_55315 [Streptomyces sp. NPDC055722]